MKIILQQPVDKLGDPGDVVEVADGYARNYLIPRSLAVRAHKGAAQQAENLRRAHERRQYARKGEFEAIASRLIAGGPIAREYWDAFLRRFDPDAALEHSRWEIGSVGNDRAEILLTHHGADRPATLKMFLEDGEWRAGLVETFWGRR